MATAPRLSPALLTLIEDMFRTTYTLFGTEDRLLIFRDGSGRLHPERPEMERRTGYVQGDIDLNREVAGDWWDLAYDLHSHHVMGAFWSSTDDANERLRGIAFGVFSWRQESGPTWLFRRFDGKSFVDLPYSEVVGDG